MDTVQPLTVLRDFRRNHQPRLSQGELADRIGVVRETVARWELGHRKIDEEKLPAVTLVTGIPARDLRPDLAARFVEAAE
jgi:transcriptional regulator with XRE-family HTH domain